MGDVINLRLARKQRGRAEADTQAAASRALHGQTKAAKRLARDEAARQTAKLDGAKLDG